MQISPGVGPPSLSESAKPSEDIHVVTLSRPYPRISLLHLYTGRRPVCTFALGQHVVLPLPQSLPTRPSSPTLGSCSRGFVPSSLRRRPPSTLARRRMSPRRQNAPRPPARATSRPGSGSIWMALWPRRPPGRAWTISVLPCR